MKKLIFLIALIMFITCGAQDIISKSKKIDSISCPLMDKVFGVDTTYWGMYSDSICMPPIEYVSVVMIVADTTSDNHSLFWINGYLVSDFSFNFYDMNKEKTNYLVISWFYRKN